MLLTPAVDTRCPADNSDVWTSDATDVTEYPALLAGCFQLPFHVRLSFFAISSLPWTRRSGGHWSVLVRLSVQVNFHQGRACTILAVRISEVTMGGVQWCMARPPRDPSLLSWPWGSAPSGSGGPSSAVGLTSLPIVNSHAESAAMLADPMVGYWCRVGSLALTHTRTDIFGAVHLPFGISGEQCSAFLLSRPPPVCTKVVGCVSSVYCQDWSLLLRECGQGLVPWFSPKSSPLMRSSPQLVCFFCSECMPVMSCIGPQSPAYGRGPVARCHL